MSGSREDEQILATREQIKTTNCDPASGKFVFAKFPLDARPLRRHYNTFHAIRLQAIAAKTPAVVTFFRKFNKQKYRRVSCVVFSSAPR